MSEVLYVPSPTCSRRLAGFEGWRGTLAWIALVTLAGPHVAMAQPRGGTTYVEAGPALTMQSGPSGTESQTYVTAPGGRTVGWLLGAGVHVARHASIHAEWSTTGRMTAVEPSRYFTTYNEERRDRFLTFGVRIHIPVGHALSIEPMAGAVFTFPRASSQAVYTDPLFPRPAQPRVTHRLNVAAGPAVGCDVRLGSGAISLVPSFRILRSAVSSGRYDSAVDSPPSEIASIYPGGYPRWTTRAAVALRVQF